MLNSFRLINKKIDGEFFCPVDMLLRHPRQSIISQKKWERSFRRAFFQRFSAKQLLAYKQKKIDGEFFCPVDMLLRHPRQSIISQKKWDRSFRKAFYQRFSAEQLLAYKQKKSMGNFFVLLICY